MSEKNDGLITVLDAGSARTRVLVAQVREGILRYQAHGTADAAGVRKGVISDLATATKSIDLAATEAERMANTALERCVVGIGGPHIRGVNSQGGISLGPRMR